MNAKDRLIVALDVPDVREARGVLDELAGCAGVYKIGHQLFTAGGPDFVREVVSRGEKVFLDLKYHDIPNTVAAAVSGACRLGVSFVDVHALGGRAMLQAAAGALPAMGARLLAVTVLTSMDEPALSEIGVEGALLDSVKRLALLARDAGADGVVCSPLEVALVREACGPGFVIVTPGVRPAGTERGDQARAATPGAAIAAGADYVVVGRPVLEAKDRRAAAEAVVADLEAALSSRTRP